MLTGHFENCYGLELFDLIEIPFSSNDNKTIIYAPNGVMKSSLANVFDNLSRKKKTEDRIFTENSSTFAIKYYDDTFNEKYKKAVPNIYVINSFNATFESYNDSIATILADDELKRDYSEVMHSFAERLRPLFDALQRHCTPGVSIQELVSVSFCGTPNAEWDSIIKSMKVFLDFEKPSELLASVRYDEIFTPQVEKVINTPGFSDKIKRYVGVVDSIIRDSRLLNTEFDDRNARDFGDSIAKTKLFDAHHRILLSDGTVIASIKEWSAAVDAEMTRINEDVNVKALYSEIDKALNANTATKKLRDIIKSNHMLLAFFDDIVLLRKRLWASYAVTEGINIDDLANAVEIRNEDLKRLNRRAADQQERWKRVIDVFRERFRAPFTVSIENESKVIFHGEPARLEFTYNRRDQTRAQSKENLMNYLSVGEKRAFYILQILFDLEKIRASAITAKKKHLVIVDDIADSFDYSNKYAIIEYLDELSRNKLIDLLILTHNFDFYRTVSSRLGINYNMCFVVQKDAHGSLLMEKFAYKKDYFTNGILENIRNGKIGDDPAKIILIIASIPFCRNIAQYLGLTKLEESLTSLLHIKQNSTNIKLSDYWESIRSVFNLNELDCPSLAGIPIINTVFNIAQQLVREKCEAVSLENKIVMSIAIRLKSELFLQLILKANNEELSCEENQTQVWINHAQPYLTQVQKDTLNAVKLITPESIHVNAFMYEPLIDIPNWQLFNLFTNVETDLVLCNKK